MHSNILKTLDQQIRYCLEHFPDTRNSDVTLTIEVWKQFYPETLITARNGKLAIYVDQMFTLPREDNIKRIRARIQNDLGQFLPTVESVAIKRGWNIEEWRSYLYPKQGQLL